MAESSSRDAVLYLYAPKHWPHYCCWASSSNLLFTSVMQTWLSHRMWGFVLRPMQTPQSIANNGSPRVALPSKITNCSSLHLFIHSFIHLLSSRGRQDEHAVFLVKTTKVRRQVKLTRQTNKHLFVKTGEWVIYESRFYRTHTLLVTIIFQWKMYWDSDHCVSPHIQCLSLFRE